MGTPPQAVPGVSGERPFLPPLPLSLPPAPFFPGLAYGAWGLYPYSLAQPIVPALTHTIHVQPCFIFPVFPSQYRMLPQQAHNTNIGIVVPFRPALSYDTPAINSLATHAQNPFPPADLQTNERAPRQAIIAAKIADPQPLQLSSLSSSSDSVLSSSSSTFSLSVMPTQGSPTGTRNRSSGDFRLLGKSHEIRNQGMMCAREGPVIPSDFLYIPRLVGQSNFKEWDDLIRPLLIQMGLYDHIYNPKQKPNVRGITPSYPPVICSTSSDEEKRESEDWWVNDACVRMILSMKLSKAVARVAVSWSSGETARDTYKLLWRVYGPPGLRRDEQLSGIDRRGWQG